MYAAAPINLQNFKVTLTYRDDDIVNMNGVDWWAIIELVCVVPNNSTITEIQTQQVQEPSNQNIPSYLRNQNQNQNITLWMKY